MRVPIAWLRAYVDLPESARAIADRLATIGFPVDTIEQRPPISGVVAGRVVALEKHPNADRLQVGTIDVGAAAPLTVATAATNVAVGQTIAVATIGAKLPKLTIEPRKMRGIDSQGMMISADELALPADWFEDGIMQFDDDLAPGTDIVAHFGLNDAVLAVDVTTNRPDALSIIGLARELAASLGTALRAPSLDNPATQPDPSDSAPRVTVESSDCTRFVAQRFTGIVVGTAPTWLRVRLALAGQRPINSIVDVSNYVMLETGQPLHFYDDARIVNHHLIVRDARPGEKLVTLDDLEHELSTKALVIADERGALGLAGLKGGKSSEIDPSTTSLVLESANFSGPRIRRMSADLGFRTDASSRHEKNLAPALTDAGAARAAQLLVALGATAYFPHAFGAPLAPADPIRFALRDVKRLLGLELDAPTIAGHLAALGCTTAPAGDGALDVTPPAWRGDLVASIDLVEEVARMAGYDSVEAQAPPVFAHEISSREFRLERTVARTLVGLGYDEILTHSMHGGGEFDRMRRAGIEPSLKPVEIKNPLSEDQRYLRHAMGPGLSGYFARTGQPARVFEVGHVFGYDERGHVAEEAVLTFGFTVAEGNEPTWSDRNLLRLKGDAIELIRSTTGRTPTIVRDTRNGMHPGKTAVLLLEGHEVAVFGRVDPRLEKAFDLPFPEYIAHVYLDTLPDYVTPHYRPPSRFPSTYRDLALVVALDVDADRIAAVAREGIGQLATDARVFDEYRGPQVGEDRKSLALRLTMQRNDATITDAEADAAVARALEALHEQLDATIRA
ncbi:MAG TPA: phenylalanine--tRNA ligase subunit beta [Verrucomicrobiae bacterium]|jgi:phenylalanyl-tRNA synthetase beta chain|nr:phenylalanine--tRNA ligase subunit beta [Verrucomicrobiae bacterium]